MRYLSFILCLLFVGTLSISEVSAQTDDNGQLVLSRKRAKHMRTWAKILDAESNDVILEGKIKRRTKGGFVVDISGIEAFLPEGQAGNISDATIESGEMVNLKLVKSDAKKDELIVSNEGVSGESHQYKQRAKLLKTWTHVMVTHKEGLMLNGKVKRRTKGGFVVDIDGIEAFLPEKQAGDVKIGQTARFKVTELDEATQKVNISLK